jgi:hypothetical protein
MDAAAVTEALAAEGVQSRRYYTPPAHRQQVYLLLWKGMADEQVDGVGAAMARLAGRRERG